LCIEAQGLFRYIANLGDVGEFGVLDKRSDKLTREGAPWTL